MNLSRYRFILQRPLQLLPVLIGISLVTFALVRSIPGDPARILLGVHSTPEALANIREQYGLDQPLWAQYFYFLKNIFQGDMGKSLLYKIDVLRLITTRIEPTLFLVLGSVLMALLIAIPLATLAARNKGTWVDNLIRVFTTTGLGMPAFWLGIMLILLFSVQFGWFPVSGYGRDWLDKFHHMVLPCLTIALALSAVLVRNLRASMLMELQADHVTAARARGLSEASVFRRHVLPNSLVPSINLLAVNIGWLISGTVVIESLFAIPGIGQLLVRGIVSRDYMVVQGVAMVLACATVVVNFVADVATVAVDPRVNIR
jgi:peptide/nickel transport system permease protein